MSPRTPRLIAVAACLAALWAPAAAHADTYDAVDGGCPSNELARPFLPWADVMQYFLAPGGTFENSEGDRWALDDARRLGGNEPWEVSGPGSKSLRIAAGGSATAPAVCVGLDAPTIRFFVRGPRSPLAGLKVEALVGSPTYGVLNRVPIGLVSGVDGNWAPSLPFAIVKNMFSVLPGNQVAVAFRFTASGGAFQIDDVYVDPYGKR